MAYTDREWDKVLGFLNTEAEKPEPDGIGKAIETADEFVHILRTTEAIKPQIVASDAHDRRDFARLQRDKAQTDQAAIDLQNEIDNHPGRS